MSHESLPLQRSKRPAAVRLRAMRWIELGVALVIALLIVLPLVQVGVPGWQAYRAVDRLRALAADGLTGEDGPLVAEGVESLDTAIQKVADRLGSLDFVLRGLRWIPTWGATFAATPELAALGREFSAMGQELGPLAARALQETDMLARGVSLLGALEDDPERIERLAFHAESAAQAYRALPVATLHPALAGRLDGIGPLLDVLPTLMKALPSIPTLMGMESPHTYLVLVQNNHELRATGGFITAVARMTLDQGRIVEMDFRDVYEIFNYDAIASYPPAPAPVAEYMRIPYLSFRDSNWSPDLFTTVRVAGSIYRADTGLDFDSVVTIDLNAVEQIIDALSPLSLEGVDEAVTGENILPIMKELWARPADTGADIEVDLGSWWAQRKDFIPELAQAVVRKVMGGQADFVALATSIVATLDRRNIQVYSTIDSVTSVLSTLGWDGRLQPPNSESGDYLALVDMNMGYNKANAVVERTLAYSVTWPTAAAERPLAEVAITYTDTYTGTPTLCAAEARYGTSYDDMVHRCYFNYLRLYVPGGSTLEEMTGVQEGSISSLPGEKGTQVFAGYFSLNTNSSRTVRIRYRLPETVTPDEYSLRIQRQSGTGALPVTLRIGDWTDAFLLSEGTAVWSRNGSTVRPIP